MLKLEIVTPEKRVLDTEVETVTLPTASGEAGILQHHAPLISALKPGVLSYVAKGTTDKLVVSAGFVEVNSDVVSVLVDTAEMPAEIDVAAAKTDLDAAEKAISAAGLVPSEQAEDAYNTLEHASARLRTAAGK